MSDKTPPDDERPTETASPPEGDPPQIGPYRVLEKIGEGGMGEVYRAEQDKPIRRRVALKLIKLGMDTKQVIGRFESERQALAMMDHPSIAKVFDAGTTPDGRPYFSMEYVKGEPITRYCDRHRLTTRERLDLFMQVCDGVQHAHQKGIIHRDIKASNVLVAIQDEKPVPKIIDFGVAKATEQKLTERTVYTQMGVLIGTPEYMSPEQAEMTGLDIDTRTDVYSLGVLLYELLTGVLPFDPEELRKSGFDEIRRKIREEEPSRPSTRITTLGGEAASTLTTTHRAELPALRKQLKGDLDWITMMALEKDRTRRYQSPTELAADIERHLTDQPVVASPPSAAYRAGKFVRRHKGGVAAGVVVAVALALGITGAAVGLVRARRAEAQARKEAETAKQVSDFLVGLFEVSDPSEARGNTITAREILEKGAQKVDRELDNQPVVQARLMHTIGEVYLSLGLYSEAVGLLEQALVLRREVLGDDHLDTLKTMLKLGMTYWVVGRWEAHLSLVSEVAERGRRVLGQEHPITLYGYLEVGDAYMYRENRVEEGQARHIEVLEIRRRTLGEEHRDTLYSMDRVAGIYADRGQLDEAEALLLETLEIRRRTLGADHPATIASMNNLAVGYLTVGRYDEAERRFLEMLEIGRRVGGDSSDLIQYPMHNLAVLCGAQGRYEEAEEWQRQVLELRRRWRGEDHPATLGSMAELAGILSKQNRHSEAEVLYIKSLEMVRQRGDADAQQEAGLLLGLARLYLMQNDPVLADSYFREYLAADKGPRGHIFAQEAGYHVFAGDQDKAIKSLQRAVEFGHPRAWIAHDPEFAPLHGDPEFDAIVAEVRRRLEEKDPAGPDSGR